MKKKLLLTLVVLFALSMTLVACGGGGGEEAAEESGEATQEEESGGEASAAAPEVTLVLTQHDPDASLPGQYCFEWADLVKEKSGGRIEVQVNNGGSIAKPTESLGMVKEGTVDLAWGLQSFYPGEFPLTDGLSLPYLPFTSAEQASRTIMDIYENTDLLADEYAGYKVILLRANCDAPIITTDKKLNTAADLSGLTLRATAAPIVSWLGAFGANAQGVPINELYSVLQNGAMQGAITDWHGIDSFKIYEVAKEYADEKVQYNTYYFLMNKAKYDGLSDDLKAVIDDCSGQTALELMVDAWDNLTDSTKAKVNENGGEIYTLPDAEHQKLVDAANEARDAWLGDNGDKGQQLYDKALELAPTYE
ncbi:MAG: TRAP transporter substrate-binding protein DctP [Clostridiales Family XIII bacterium]|jgi:TRAP-type C4-dicarboxylate transport system substrate-binding protein|nr:TRAP transporter substrate-binding protein DctP [Clostridiales Family XIII bacterium]